MSIEALSSMATVLGVCIAGVNIIVEVLKNIWGKDEAYYPSIVLGVSLFMAFFMVCVYCNINHIAFTPLIGVGTFAGGFFLSYGAMFGYDNLYGNFIKEIEHFFKGDKE